MTTRAKHHEPERNLRDNRSLRSALRTNAAFSGATGGGIAAFSWALPEVMGAGGKTLYLVIGLLLLAYALRLFFLARGESIPRKEGILVVLGDAGWVLGSGVLLGMGILTAVGATLVAAAAVVVGGLAIWQGRNLPDG